jgi:hypothetical protein
MKDEGCPPPILEPGEANVLCALPAHPRYAILQDLRSVEQSLAIGELGQAQSMIQSILEKDPLNARAVQLFSEIQSSLHDPAPIFDFLKKIDKNVFGLPPSTLVQLSEALMSAEKYQDAYIELSQKLLLSASRGRLEEREFRRIGVAMIRSYDEMSALTLIDSYLKEHQDWGKSAWILQLRGNALLGLAKRCRFTAKKPDIPANTRQRAWKEFHSYLEQADHELRLAHSLSMENILSEQIQKNLDYLNQLRKDNLPPKGRSR